MSFYKTVSTAKQILSDADAEEIDTVKYLIKKVAYAERDLNTELGKMKYIQDRWMEYLDSSDSEKHNRCYGYIHWAGYNPDSRFELEELRTMIQMAELQIENLQLKRIALTEMIPSCLSDLAEAERSNHTGPSLFPYEQEIEDDVSVQPDYMNPLSDSIQQADSTHECDISSSGNVPSNTWWTESYKQARKYLYGSKTEKPQLELAYQLMLQEAAKDNGLALHDLAKMHQTGLGCNQDHTLAEKLFSDAYCAFLRKLPSEKNPAYLQYRIGKLFLQGLGVEKNYATAAEWFEKSSAAGNPYAAYSLASLYHHGQGVELNEEKAFSLYKIAASNTHAPNAYAAYELGNMYKTGKGTEKDIEASEQWYRKAYTGFLKLEQSTLDDTLLYRLGQMNAKGIGTDVDTTKAISYYEKAAKLKNTNALYGLGMLYINPSLPEYNPQKAIPYLEEAAESEDPFAQYQLGKLHLTGEHVSQDTQTCLLLPHRQLTSAFVGRRPPGYGGRPPSR